MKIFFWEQLKSKSALLEAVISNQVIAGTSDTVIGLFAVASRATFDKLNRIKGRVGKPYLLLVCDKQKINTYIDGPIAPGLGRLIAECWPGPLTLIFKANTNLPYFLKSEDNTIAIRVPNHEGLHRLLTHIDALFSTSANIAGEAIPKSVEEIDPSILEKVAMIIDDEVPKQSTVASTILDVTGSSVKVIREGAYPIVRLEEIYGKAFVR